MAQFKPDPEFNPYAVPASDFAGDSDGILAGSQETGRKLVYAKFSQRVYAFLLDGLILYALMVIGNLCVLFLIVIPFFKNSTDGIYVGMFFSYGILTWPFLYFALLESSGYQATIGKRIMGIKVTNLEGGRIGFGQATGRFLSKIPSAFFLFLGFFIQPFTAKKQALHDLSAGTLVVDTRG